MTSVGRPAEFDDIRPYDDSEVAAVLPQLIADNELVDVLIGSKLPWLPRSCFAALRPWVRVKLRKVSAQMDSIEDFHRYFMQLFMPLLEKSSDGLSFSGFEQLGTAPGVLISNHRDIALDPLLVWLGLASVGRPPVRIAIGDNLVSKPYVGHLMRLSRTFLVRRGISGRREKLDALKRLSAYIRYSISSEQQSVWIAQREGRAKDGDDWTETALLKMLALSAPKQSELDAALAPLNLQPIALSYEWDPCDIDKARELACGARGEIYQKRPDEDVETIYKGLFGYKGRIHVAATPAVALASDASTLAANIDRVVHVNFKLFPSHLTAWRHLNPHDEENWASLRALYPHCDWPQVSAQFAQRLDGQPSAIAAQVWAAYAKPVSNALLARP
ncbi:hypothetical protein E3W66_00335 [Gammaproteobacteria bacterium LSUCC0057]|uniref:Phospholipid/glycerol acyltransferase domain-containing protein n=1 Tax=Gammaproteobacteria bacterium LSUCC0057 TaxID=2559237 RepID=A0A4Y8UHW7_9GAMM|nr:hypothetical protein E3W66_00335 [Gammaproteobacteria bacterium LSUCC0057]